MWWQEGWAPHPQEARSLPALCPPGQRSAEGTVLFPRVSPAGIWGSTPVPEVEESRKGQKRTKHLQLVKTPTLTLPAPSEQKGSLQSGSVLGEEAACCPGQISSDLFISAHLGELWQVAASTPMPTPVCHLLLGGDMAIPICPHLSQTCWGHTSLGGTGLPLRPTAPAQRGMCQVPSSLPPKQRPRWFLKALGCGAGLPTSASPPLAPHLAATPPLKKTQMS